MEVVVEVVVVVVSALSWGANFSSCSSSPIFLFDVVDGVFDWQLEVIDVELEPRSSQVSTEQLNSELSVDILIQSTYLEENFSDTYSKYVHVYVPCIIRVPVFFQF